MEGAQSPFTSLKRALKALWVDGDVIVRRVALTRRLNHPLTLKLKQHRFDPLATGAPREAQVGGDPCGVHRASGAIAELLL